MHITPWRNFFSLIVLLVGFLPGTPTPKTTPTPSPTPTATAALTRPVGRMALTTPETDKFPQVSLYLDAYDNTGRFLDDLTPQDLQLLENNLARPVESLEKYEPGLQFILALNTAPIWLNLSGGATLYRHLQDALINWGNAQDPAIPNDYSLAANTGLQVVRQRSPQEWVKAVQIYQPNLMLLQPSPVSLSQALDLATDPNPNPLMKRAILYVTAPLLPNQVAALPSTADRAAQLGVRIFIWLVGDRSAAKSDSGMKLQQVADRTGGSMYVFSGPEPLPDIDEYLKPMRQIYQLTYQSGIRASGTQRLSIQLTRPGLKVASPEKTFDLTVLPPNPILISPPSQVQRTWSVPASMREESRLVPDTITLQVMVEYPDGFIRPLKASRLLVDGEVVDENDQPPFDQFTWPLAVYTTSGSHTLQVQVEDQLGLSQSTALMSIPLNVEAPRAASLGGTISTGRLAIAGAVLVAAIILAVVLLTAGRRRQLRSRTQKRKAQRDPLTQPIIPQNETPQPRIAASKVDTWLPPAPPAPAPARFVCPDGSGSIPLSRNEITFGSDPRQSLVVLNDPSVSGLHARLHHTNDGCYILTDTGSIAGTWVNYSPVSALGVQLSHGDWINFGRAVYRFELANPGPLPQPVIIPFQEDKP